MAAPYSANRKAIAAVPTRDARSLSGTEESPARRSCSSGPVQLYRGMVRWALIAGTGRDRYATASERGGHTSSRARGIEGRVPYAGPLGDTIYQLVGACAVDGLACLAT